MARTALALPFSGAKLRELRERAGLTQQDLADASSAAGKPLTRTQITKWETNVNRPTAPGLRALTVALGCRIDDLLDAVA